MVAGIPQRPKPSSDGFGPMVELGAAVGPVTCEDLRARGVGGLHRGALHWACSTGRSDLVAALLEGGAKWAAVDPHGWTALHWAVNNRHAACAKALLERHPALLAFNGRAPAPAALLDTAAEALLQDPAVSDTAPAVQLSERAGAGGRGPQEDIWDQAERGDVLGLLRCLQPHRPCPSARGAYQRTPLHWACAAGHAAAAALLLAVCHEAAVQRPQTFQDIQGNTPLHLAVLNGHVQCVEAIAEHPAVMQLWKRLGPRPEQLTRNPEVLAWLTWKIERPVDGNQDLNLCGGLPPRHALTVGHLRALFHRFPASHNTAAIRVVLGLEEWTPEGHRWFFQRQQRRIQAFCLTFWRLQFVPEDLLWVILQYSRNE
eukprot:EG_transcript_9173